MGGVGSRRTWSEPHAFRVARMLIATSTTLCLGGCDGAEADAADGSREERVAEHADAVWDRGSDAGNIEPGAYPWLVHLNTNCGGAFVASNVVLTARHCVAGDPGVNVFASTNITGNVDLTNAIDALRDVSPTVLVPYPNLPALTDEDPGREGSDVALLVYPRRLAIPRRLLLPATIPLQGSAVPSAATLVSHVRHSTDCLGSTAHPTFLNLGAADTGEDQDHLPKLSFDTEDSYSCKGDSGSPIVEGRFVVSVVATAPNAVANGGPGVNGPWLSSLSSGLRPWLTTHAVDRDGDGVESWEDNCDTRFNPDQRDLDGDGVGEVCDACPIVPDERLYDRDGDGVIDCLDACPDDAPADSVPSDCAATLRGQQGDSDCDGICDHLDVCPSTPGTSLPNSNTDAETAWQAEVLPDLCDPVLVPRGEVNLDAVTISNFSSIDTTFYKAATWVEERDTVTMTNLPSARHPGSTGDASVSAGAVPEHVRFCQPSNTIPDCGDPTVINQGELHLELADAGDEQAGHPYHRVKVAGAAQRGSPLSRPHNGSNIDLVWKWRQDEAFWSDSHIIEVEPETWPFLPGVTTSGLDGTMWFHTASTIGHPGGASLGTGVHTAARDITNSEQLASSYFALDPESIQHRERDFPLELDRPLFLWQFLPDPPPDELASHLWGVDPADDLMIVETTSHDWGFLDRQGLVEPLDDVLGAQLQQSLADPTLRWATTAEASASLAAPDAPLAVAVNAEGTQIAESVRLGEGSSFMGLGDRGGDGDPTHEASRLDVASTPMMDGDFIPVYATSRGWVFLVGGRTATGAPRGIRRIDAVSGLAFDMHLPVDLGEVLAATFDPIAGELVILDELVVDSVTRVRLLRIEGSGRGARVLDSWRRHHRFDDLTLLMDGRNRLLLAASKDPPRKHRVFELEEHNGRIRAHKLVGGPRSLATRPWSTETALFLALQKPNGEVKLERTTLPARDGLGDIEECL